MPIKETAAKLWFNTKKEEEEYDDKMIASIELKSLDFDDENFSPVFNRATQEVFLSANQRYNSDIQRMIGPFRSMDFEQAVDKWLLWPANHTFNRTWPQQKFVAGFGLSYLIWRELPFRNFYARSFLMILFASKFMDNLYNLAPLKMLLLVNRDNNTDDELRCYNAYDQYRFRFVPNSSNKLRENWVWQARQPGHMFFNGFYYAGHMKYNFRQEKEAAWDGTMNMPLYRLTDKKHKDSHMMMTH